MGSNQRPMQAPLYNVAVTYRIHKLKVFVFDDASRTSRWQSASKAFCEIWDHSWINGMEFEQFVILLLD